MIFKDRQEAGRLLAQKLQQNKLLPKQKGRVIIISLLRGGFIVGDSMAKHLKIKHYPLVATKISTLYNRELAIGALCQDVVHINREAVSPLLPDEKILKIQISIAKQKQKEHLKKFNLENTNYFKIIKNKVVILVDDGIATGATVRTAEIFIKQNLPKKVILAVPVAPIGFYEKDYDQAVILQKNIGFSSVSQFYAYFPQVKDEEVLNLMRK